MELDVSALIQSGGIGAVLWFVLTRMEKRVGRMELLLERLVALQEAARGISAMPSEEDRSPDTARPRALRASGATRPASEQ